MGWFIYMTHELGLTSGGASGLHPRAAPAWNAGPMQMIRGWDESSSLLPGKKIEGVHRKYKRGGAMACLYTKPGEKARSNLFIPSRREIQISIRQPLERIEYRFGAFMFVSLALSISVIEPVLGIPQRLRTSHNW